LALPTGSDASSVESMLGSTDTTQLLLDARDGDRQSFDRLYVRLYQELRAVARRRLRGAPLGETLDTSALVHDAYVRLVDQGRVDVRDRGHFLALAARAMRFIVVDYARARQALKRGGGRAPMTLERAHVSSVDRAEQLVALDDALRRLEGAHERLGRVVELRFFGGLTHPEIAAALGCSVPTVKRDWVRARAWLYRFMTAEA